MNVLGISGSPTGGSSTDIIVNAVLEGASADHVKTRFIRLNEKNIIPCQSCGQSPYPNYCFFHDDMDEIFGLMEKSEGIILGSPIFFDSVSAQAKLFIDRTNCLRPVDFSATEETVFRKPLFIDTVFELRYISRTLRVGEAADDQKTMERARQCGQKLLTAIQARE
jgi:multimeric flavodoxin WrbA